MDFPSCNVAEASMDNKTSLRSTPSLSSVSSAYLAFNLIATDSVIEKHHGNYDGVLTLTCTHTGTTKPMLKFISRRCNSDGKNCVRQRQPAMKRIDKMYTKNWMMWRKMQRTIWYSLWHACSWVASVRHEQGKSRIHTARNGSILTKCIWINNAINEDIIQSAHSHTHTKNGGNTGEQKMQRKKPFLIKLHSQHFEMQVGANGWINECMHRTMTVCHQSIISVYFPF